MDDYENWTAKKLAEKTIKTAEVTGYLIRMEFTDGTKFSYDASDGGYSSWSVEGDFDAYQEDTKTTDAESSPEKMPSDIARNLFASRLNGREYGKEITKEEIEEAKEKGFVVIYGYSDDNVEICGALMDEIGAWNGARIAIDNKGVGLYEEESRKYEITALWDGKLDDRLYMKNGYDCHDENEDLIPWTFDTGIPHSTFMIYEDEEPFCRGIVINMEDLK